MKHPDFNEWLKTKDGEICNDMHSIKEQKYLTNRLFWAFDAGRNCVWDQYMKQKELINKLELENAELKKLITVNETTKSKPMKTPEEILADKMVKSGKFNIVSPTNEQLPLIINAMNEYASQFYSEEQVREAFQAGILYMKEGDVNENLYIKNLKEQSKQQSEQH